MRKIPIHKSDNASAEIIQKRREFVAETTGSPLRHVNHHSLDPSTTTGNIENFIGVAQVPIGLAGPLLVKGEHADGEFFVPLATTEGTLVASYNRGMKVLQQCGGAQVTISGESMQRAPVFIFDNARDARDFVRWIEANFPKIKEVAESTTRTGKLLNIDSYTVGKFVYSRFNMVTGDAAGQNMVGKATFGACQWISENCTLLRRYYLESNFASDKKSSALNTLRTRGKRVTAEAVLDRKVVQEVLRTTPESLTYHFSVALIGGFVSGVNNNGLHSANGITSVFIATGQDVANVAESSAGVLFAEVTKEGNFYISLTIPSLIVGTYGGGTGLGTQRECLEILGCYGSGKANKFAEIVAATCLAGEISLAGSISSLEWVEAHERYGRNRP